MNWKNNKLVRFNFLFALLACFGSANAQHFELVYPGGGPWDGKIIETLDANLVVLTSSGSTYNNTLMKLDFSGNTIWEIQLSNPNFRATDIVELPNGRLVVAGTLGNNTFTWQVYLPAGGFLAEYPFFSGLANVVCSAATLSPNGNAVITGFGEQAPNFGSSIVFEVSENGTVNWETLLVYISDMKAIDVEFLENGTGVIGYNVQSTTQFGIVDFEPSGNLLSNHLVTQFQGVLTDLSPASDGGLFAGLFPVGMSSSVMKMDGNFQIAWLAQPAGNWGELYSAQLAATDDGGCAATGNTVGQFLHLFKLNANGGQEYFQSWEDSPFTAGGRATSIIATSDGGFAFTGDLYDPNLFVIKTDSIGISNIHLVTGQLWLDLNGNCTLEQSDDQVPFGWTIQFAGEDTVVAGLDPATGAFNAFLDTGSYAVSINPASNPLLEFQLCQPLPMLNLANIGDTTELGLLLAQPVQNAFLNGTVFFDLDQDSEHDPGEPTLPCADLQITSTFPGLDTIIQSDASGFYSFGVSKFVSYKITGVTTLPNCIFSQNFHLVYVDSTAEAEDIGIGCWDFSSLPGIVRGHVDFDLDGDCQPDANGNVGSGWYVAFHHPAGGVAQAFPDAEGDYSIALSPGNYQVSVMTTAGAWQVCNAISSFTVAGHDCQEVNLVVQLPNCPSPTVEVAVNVFRPCFTSQIGIHYCNLGTDPAYNAEVQLVLDPALNFIIASSPVAAQSGDTLWFNLGDLDPLECGQFTVQAYLDCQAIVGQTHCVEAHIYPDTLCQQNSPLWDGSNIELASRCENDTVFFTIKNTGLGNMAGPLPYLVIEDNVLLKPDEIMAFQLLSGADTTFAYPVHGQMLRLETQQRPGHPSGKHNAVWEEGCGASPASNFSRGFVTQYPYGDEEQFLDVFCGESVGSFDPNIKKAFPKGSGPQHFIKNTTGLDYQILFQNTGTAPAFQVVVRDTLSPLLDPATLQPGASSHHYIFTMENGNVVVFTFNNINLPDSMSSPDGSIGFIQFRIAQAAGNLPGAVIENDAAIYFDFNEPVITPTVFHQIPLPVYTQTSAVSLCAGESWQGEVYPADTTLRDTISFAYFDSIYITEITLRPLSTSSLFATLCNGESMTVNGTVYDASHPAGTELLVAMNGCDSVVDVSLSFLPAIQVDFIQTLCAAESVVIGNTVYNAANPEGTEVITAANGCDSVVQVALSFYPELTATFAETLCAGESLTFNGTVYDETHPTGTEVFTAANGCDSLVNVSLNFLPHVETMLNATLCFGGSLEINGTVYDENNPSGEALFTAANGCDSVVAISLSFGEQAIGELELSLCPGESIVINGSIYDEANPVGSELFPNGSYLGCDSVVQILLSFYQPTEGLVLGPICEDESITVNGTEYDASQPTGVEVLTNAAANGCDSTVYVDLEILFNSFAAFDTTLLPGDVWQGIQFWSDTAFTQVFPLSNGCDSIVDVTVAVLVDGVRGSVAVLPKLKVYPNPAGSFASVELVLPVAVEFSLKLVNTFGQLVQPIVGGEKWAAGKYVVHLDLEALASGVYWFWFVSTEGQDVLKIVKKG